MIAAAELAELHAAVEQALERGEQGELPVIGYGEMSLGVGWPAGEPRVVAKRLPAFPDRGAFDRYARSIADYVEALADRGVIVVETRMEPVAGPGATVVGYALQPVLPAASLGPAVLAAADPAAGHPLLERITDLAAAVVSPRLGLDAQLSNWGWVDGEAHYFDVTTPMINDPDGRPVLDMEILLAAYPWAVRPALRRFVAPTVLARYHDRRSVLRDIAANLVKERLEPWMDATLAAANRHLDAPLTAAEARKDYRSDARMWEWVQRIRRADRAWHRLRGRTYPFLIPGEIQR